MTEYSFQITIPTALVGQVEIGDPYVNYTARGNPSSFGIDIRLPELSLTKQMKSSDLDVLKSKIESALRVWEEKYKRHQDRVHKDGRSESVDQFNAEAEETLAALEGLLAHTLAVNDAVDWDRLKVVQPYRVNPEDYLERPKDRNNIFFQADGEPKSLSLIRVNREPDAESIRNKFGFFDKLFGKKKIESAIANAKAEWRSEVENVSRLNKELTARFEAAKQEFAARKAAYEAEVARKNGAVEILKAAYGQREAKAVEEYCDLVLEASEYPDSLPRNWILEYRADNKILVIEYDLPSPDQLPKVEAYKYVKSRDEVTEKQIPDAKKKRLYESVIYQICLRTIHELFEADVIGAIDAVAFNGFVTSINPATGVSETKVIISVIADRDQFLGFDLANVDPKATFKHMKGVAAATLIDLAPIPPVLRIEKSDKRFIEGREIVASLDGSENIAAMDWADFEHLIRELFEREFAGNGGEVRVTQASSDGGVDAIAFDPDPIRGGKIVIQAKRYTNVVGVAAVRDLYGTVLNEGATKGILVTTSNYGKDSYEFAKGKPLTLLNGNNLLSLLEKHGHRARINIEEARHRL